MGKENAFCWMRRLLGFFGHVLVIYCDEARPSGAPFAVMRPRSQLRRQFLRVPYARHCGSRTLSSSSANAIEIAISFVPGA